jgi:hypothetical protein
MDRILKNRDIITEWKIAKRFAASRGFGDYAEDFQQYYAQLVLSGRKCTMMQGFIDFCRCTFGDPERKKQRKLDWQGLSADMDLVADTRDPYFKAELGYAMTILDEFKPQERALFILSHYFGFSNVELATIFGLGSDRIYGILREINEELRVHN